MSDFNTITIQQLEDGATCAVAVLARLLDLDERRIQQLAQENIVVKVDRGLYDISTSVSGYVKNIRANLPAPGKRMDFNGQRSRLTAARADLAELEKEEKVGSLIDAEGAEKAAFDLARKAQEALVSIPDRLASILAAETDTVKVHKLMEAEIVLVCTALADATVLENNDDEKEEEDGL